MIKNIAHIGLTVKNLDRSIKFYKDVLGLHFVEKMTMSGKETDILFNRPNTNVSLGYLTYDKNINTSLIELISFDKTELNQEKASLFKPSISEICFIVDDIHDFYKTLMKNNVKCLSEPQFFDGENKFWAIYFKDPDGIILEALQYV